MKKMSISSFVEQRAHIWHNPSLIYELFPENEMSKWDEEYKTKRVLKLIKNVKFLMPSYMLDEENTEFNFYNSAGDAFYRSEFDTIRFFNNGRKCFEVVVGKKTVIVFGETENEVERFKFPTWSDVGAFFRPAIQYSLDGLRKYHAERKMNKEKQIDCQPKQQLMNDQK